MTAEARTPPALSAALNVVSFYLLAASVIWMQSILIAFYAVGARTTFAGMSWVTFYILGGLAVFSIPLVARNRGKWLEKIGMREDARLFYRICRYRFGPVLILAALQLICAVLYDAYFVTTPFAYALAFYAGGLLAYDAMRGHGGSRSTRPADLAGTPYILLAAGALISLPVLLNFARFLPRASMHLLRPYAMMLVWIGAAGIGSVWLPLLVIPLYAAWTFRRTKDLSRFYGVLFQGIVHYGPVFVSMIVLMAVTLRIEDFAWTVISFASYGVLLMMYAAFLLRRGRHGPMPDI